ncbi:MAG: Gfo/Idh/MocA family oxidoreductase [Candidatus Eisenbacteria bacterium]|uniref:Gfo/Idh/MocA family oxidoreductase n=1 Tax=Eiseniibacteriota bacterium TaxID=2212470 RepID=A0A538SM35_UNCEI|nr:MAG: Gfo/Idh/MocA family oxidoreductase [Candidatus Eisenbacteria bacterium]
MTVPRPLNRLPRQSSREEFVARKNLQLGLVGVGAVAQIAHIPTLKRTEGLELAALCDRDPEKAARVAQKFQIPRVHARFDDLLADEAIDAVDICTPNFLHAPMASAALEAGKHVLSERPLARSAEEAAAMAKTAKKADRVLMCAVQHRFRPDAQLLKKFVEKGDLGEIFLAKAGWLRQRTAWDSDEWRRQKRESGGGVVLDLGFQMLDLALWMLGGPRAESVTASVHRSKKGEVEDSATAFLRLTTGATLSLELTWGLLMEKDFAYLNLFGSGGAALMNPLRIHKGMHGTLVNVTPTMDSSRNQFKHSIEAQIAHFGEVLRKAAKPMGHAEEILPVMELMDAILRSGSRSHRARSWAAPSCPRRSASSRGSRSCRCSSRSMPASDVTARARASPAAHRPQVPRRGPPAWERAVSSRSDTRSASRST